MSNRVKVLFGITTAGEFITLLPAIIFFCNAAEYKELRAALAFYGAIFLVMFVAFGLIGTYFMFRIADADEKKEKSAEAAEYLQCTCGATAVRGQSCPVCGRMVVRYMKKDVSVTPPAEGWVCECGMRNPENQKSCRGCSASRPR